MFSSPKMGSMRVGLAVRIRYLARLRELTGMDTENLPDVPAGTTVAALYESLRQAHPALPERAGVRAAVNLEFAGWDTEVGPNDEVAFIPPVSGGC
jgi:molybdopterin synthase sulfur carrier subunit